MDLVELLIILAKVVALTFVVVLPLVPVSVYFERRYASIIQDRVGPNRVGIPLTLFGAKKDLHFFGFMQPIADGVKLFLKEDFTPSHVRKGFFWLAPALLIGPALICVAVIPFGSSIEIAGRTIPLVIADIDAGPLFVFAIASLSVYGITLAGWSSNSKYPFLGGIRSSAQMISYEIAMGLSVIPVLMYYGDLNLVRIVEYQSQNGWLLLPILDNGRFALPSLQEIVFLVPAVIAFLIFATSVFAETNRMPFDMPECETDLVGGFHTEYSSMKFAMFFMGEYAAMVVGSAMVVTLFLGGWSLPGLDALLQDGAGHWQPWAGLVHLGIFLAKLIVFILFFIHVRWTVPRFRFDQIMRLGWIVFFEVALVNIFLAALILAAPQYSALAIGAGAILLALVTGALFWVAKTSEPDPRISQA